MNKNTKEIVIIVILVPVFAYSLLYYSKWRKERRETQVKKPEPPKEELTVDVMENVTGEKKETEDASSESSGKGRIIPKEALSEETIKKQRERLGLEWGKDPFFPQGEIAGERFNKVFGLVVKIRNEEALKKLLRNMDDKAYKLFLDEILSLKKEGKKIEITEDFEVIETEESGTESFPALSLTLSGISWDNENPVAIIDNKPLSEGESILGYEVFHIMKNKVILRKEGREYEITLPE